ncbi:hypothetical protein DEV91_13144 [Phyllobacterium brassicacearum]|nr:hypothetical protein DEV91_13144 [Phyllobacterium brassicacearum]
MGIDGGMPDELYERVYARVLTLGLRTFAVTDMP